ncbi:hypothetical protein TrLO_g15438 [Triparma laevis f. longispina]|uniref:Uncharacterized protein n=1 Tax=Triparma laevis f. longispina TaxID=1714387 RepID=A0A9W7CE21_9STRA|nr:hypothetical protein TrLO_g15438 [Triparma laevis f. longispina]
MTRRSLDMVAKARKQSLLEEERMKFFNKRDNWQGEEDGPVNEDPLGEQGVPYPKELLKAERSMKEIRLDNLKKEKEDKIRRNSAADLNKKRVSGMIRDSMLDGRKIWTEQERVDRDMNESIDTLRKFRSSKEEHKKVVKERKNSIFKETGMGCLSLDERLKIEERERREKELNPDPIDDEDYDSDKEYAVAPKFNHSWSKVSLIDKTRDEEIIRRRKLQGEGDKQYFDPENPGNPIQGKAEALDKVTKGDFVPAKKTRRKFSQEDVILRRESGIKPAEESGKVRKKSQRPKTLEGGRRNSFRKSFDAMFGFLTGDEKVHPTAGKPTVDKRPLSKHYKPYHERRPSLDLQPNIRHLLKPHERALLPDRPRNARKSRVSFENAKSLFKKGLEVTRSVKKILTERETKEERTEREAKFEANIFIKIWVMRRVRRMRKEKAATKIQNAWKEYKGLIAMEKWKIVIKLEQKKVEREELVEAAIASKAEKVAKEEKTRVRKAGEKAAKSAGYVKIKLTKKEKEEIIVRGWQPHDDALMVALHFKYGLPKSYANSDKTMKHYRDMWDTKPAKMIWKRLDMLYKADALEDVGAVIDLLTEEEQAKYCPGFGTSHAMADKANWGRKDTDFDYAHRTGGGKFVQNDQKVASQVNKYAGVEEEDWEEELNEDGIAKAQPVSRHDGDALRHDDDDFLFLARSLKSDPVRSLACLLLIEASTTQGSVELKNLGSVDFPGDCSVDESLIFSTEPNSFDHSTSFSSDLSSSAESLESLPQITREALEADNNKLHQELELEKQLHSKTKEEHTQALVKVSAEMRSLAIKQITDAVAQHSTDLTEREKTTQEKYDKRHQEQEKASQDTVRDLTTLTLTLRDAEKALNQRLHEEKFVTMKHMKQSIKLTVQLERSQNENAQLREQLSMSLSDLESREEHFYDPMFV